jgi:RNA polymerase sigma factor (sigma-70 family)
MIKKKFMRAIVESLFVYKANGDFVVRENEDALANEQTPFSDICNQELSRKLAKDLTILPNRERNVVIRHLGFDGERESFSQIAKSYGVSKQRVSQLFERALDLLRENG